MEEKNGSILKQGKKRAQIRTDGRGGDIGGLVVWGGALAVAGFIAVFAIIRRRKRGDDDATKKKYRKEDSNIGDPPSIRETHMIDSCQVVTSKSLMVVEEVSTPLITDGNAEYSTNTDQKPLPDLDIKQESTWYDQVEKGIQEEAVVFDDKMISEDVSSIISVQQQEQRQEDDEEKEEHQQQAGDEEKDVNLGGTESISTESIPEAEGTSPAESVDALSLEIKKGVVVMEDNAKECDHETNRTDANGTTTEKSASRTPLEEGKLKNIVDHYVTIHATSLRRRLWRSLSILVLLAIGLLLFTHLSISVRHLHLDTSLVP